MTINYEFSEKEITKLREELKKSRRSPGKMNETDCSIVVNTLKKKKKIESEKTTMLLITMIAQSGGTNKSAGANIEYRIGDDILSAAEIKTTIKEVNNKATFRQFCRSMQQEIGQMATKLEIEGDLSLQMKSAIPDASMEEMCWCSNFQTNNPNCPPRVRDWLKTNQETRFNK
uniref:Orf172 n=1 Tax=Rhodomonas salina TaxID=3034 RepID=Q9G8T3_RHDSA|nr:orf172 [Rhodomonas salina]AAG17764.1 orf172 [Rhodomonas salina]